MDYGIFNVRTDVNACDCAGGCTDTVRESALKADSGRKIPCRTGESNLRRQRVGVMLYQPRCIPRITIEYCWSSINGKRSLLIIKKTSYPHPHIQTIIIIILKHQTQKLDDVCTASQNHCGNKRPVF